MKDHIEIDGRKIGPGEPVYVIAEMSANHNQDIETAKKMIKTAKKCGANAIKLQTYTPDTITMDIRNENFLIGDNSPWAGRYLYDLYSDGYMPWEWYPELKKIAEDVGITLFSTAFDPSAVDYLEDMTVPVHKIASFEIVDIPLIEKMAKTGKPLLISTGMATLSEIQDAYDAAIKCGCKEIALLKCTSAYPAKPNEMNLKSINDLRSKFGCPIGLSDHSVDMLVAATATSLGVNIIEKHFTLSRNRKGIDDAFSLNPVKLKELIKIVRTVEKIMGSVRYGIVGNEIQSKNHRRSLYASMDIPKGDKITKNNIRSIRPGNGLSPKYYDEILGMRTTVKILRGTPLKHEYLE